MESGFMLRNNPSKPFWREKTSADNMRLPVKTILAGNSATNANIKTQKGAASLEAAPFVRCRFSCYAISIMRFRMAFSHLS